MDSISIIYIYILELENNKWYVGKTKNPNFRIEQHFESGGSEWTKIFKPIKIHELISNCDDFDEIKYTLKYMSMYGIDNVRGGPFCQIELPKYITINQMINGAKDICYTCGKPGHFANKCNQDNELCSRCHRKGHLVNKCYAQTTLSGEKLMFYCKYCNEEFKTLKEVTCHENICTNKVKQNKTINIDDNKLNKLKNKIIIIDDKVDTNKAKQNKTINIDSNKLDTNKVKQNKTTNIDDEKIDKIDTIEHTSTKRIKNLVIWCKKILSNHLVIAFYVIDIINNNYHFYSEDGYQNGIHKLLVPYQNFRQALSRKGGIKDMLYESDDIILYSLSSKGFTCDERKDLLHSIQYTIDTGAFTQ